MINDVLEAEGMVTLVALEGTQALRIAHKMRPDIILLDALMPSMNGFDTCQALKRSPELSTIPVIFMTGPGASSKLLRPVALIMLPNRSIPLN